MLAEELSTPGLVGRCELFQDEALKQQREHAHGQEEAGPARDPALAVEGYPATRHDPVHVGMMSQRRAPGVQHCDQADAGAEMLRVGGDGDQRLGGGLEQDGIDGGLVLIGDVGDLGRQGEDHVVVRHRQQLGLARREPVLGGRPLAFGTMAVAAGVVGDPGVGAVLAARHVTAQRRRAAVLDGRHDLDLAEAQVARPGAAPGRPLGAEDIRDLQRRTHHGAAGSGGWRLVRCQMLQRALDRTQGGAGDLAIARGRVELLVPEQDLDHPDVDLLLQEMGGEAGPQAVQERPACRSRPPPWRHQRRGAAGGW